MSTKNSPRPDCAGVTPPSEEQVRRSKSALPPGEPGEAANYPAPTVRQTSKG